MQLADRRVPCKIDNVAGEPCFVGVAILADGYLPQISSRDKHKLLRI
jgi:hypothetical protein